MGVPKNPRIALSRLLLTELEWAVNIRLFATTSPSSKNTTVALEERIVRKVIMSKGQKATEKTNGPLGVWAPSRSAWAAINTVLTGKTGSG
ncbi:MAG: hypothetical protein FRX49_04070 [Trebouxia sp. A1-2]|nr:MAG: hypothetical protein FRX49_04070 [Trebouxia sp. A1-2]